MTEVIRIVITGGPCGGKTTLLSRAKQCLLSRGYEVVVLPETATELIGAGFSPAKERWRDSLAFQSHLLDYSIEREELYQRMAGDLVTGRPRIILCDRGIPDIAAYVGKEVLVELLRKRGLRLADVFKRYRQVIHMVTAADGAEEHYTLENNAARSESPEEARALDKRTQEAWYGHPSLTIVSNEGNFEMKVSQAVSAFFRVLGIHRLVHPVERERMFLFSNFCYAFIPSNAVRREIVQTYLVEHMPGCERRVRKEVCHKDVTYYYTRKIGSKTTGERDEVQEIITVRQYEEHLCSRDVSRETVVKTRYSFSWYNRHLELDDFHNPVSLQTVEVENVGKRDVINFPPEWEMVEVTDDPRYSNRAIAGGSLKSKAA